MTELFMNTTSFNENINSWDTSNVTNMNSMFSAAYDFNQDISKWNVSKVSPKPPIYFSNSSPLTTEYSHKWD